MEEAWGGEGDCHGGWERGTDFLGIPEYSPQGLLKGSDLSTLLDFGAALQGPERPMKYIYFRAAAEGTIGVKTGKQIPGD